MEEQTRRRPRRRRRLRKFIPIVLFVMVVLCISAVLGIVFRYRPTNAEYDLNHYFALTAEEDIAVVVGSEVLEEHARSIDDRIYLPYQMLQSKVNDRFYWDASTNRLLYTTAQGVDAHELGGEVMLQDGVIYVSLDLVKTYTPMQCDTYDNPARVVIDQSEKATVAEVSGDGEVRYRGGIKSPILTHVADGDTVRILEHGEKWTQVRTDDGYIGYIEKKNLKKDVEVVYDRVSKNDGIVKQLRDHSIKLVWHQVTNQSQNDNISSRLAAAKGVNVVSPTWFYLKNNEGELASLASPAYVDYVHGLGIEVWALVDNFTTQDLSMEEILGNTATRTYVIDQLMQYAVDYQLDGINVDFEELTEKAGESFVQFIRELAIRCHQNNLVLSVDNHVPYQFNAFYNMKEQAAFADYIVMMSYDEHLNDTTGEGSVASIGYVTNAITNTLKQGVPANQLINAVPFYTRIWSETPKQAEDVTGQVGSNQEYIPYSLGWDTVGMGTAYERIAAYGAAPVWDEELQQNYAQYEADGITYKVWLEDSRSLEARLKVMQANGLAGVAAWKLGLESADVWDTILQYYP